MCEHHSGVSRRNVFRAGALAAGTIGMAGLAMRSTAFAAIETEPGACGPTADDPHFAQRMRVSAAPEAQLFAAQAAVETSYNGWPVGAPAASIGVANYTVPGTSVVLPVKSGDVATVLMYVASRFNGEVEGLDSRQCWGYGYRKNVNNPSVWSNHASGTAIDLALTPAGPGMYEAVMPFTDPGPYTFSITASSADGRLDARVQRGLYWTAPRERGGDVQRAWLADIARLSGGRELTPGDDPFSGPRPRDRRETRPLLGGAALIAFLADVVARRSARTAAAHAAPRTPQRTAA